MIRPEGNSVEYVYDTGNPDRYSLGPATGKLVAQVAAGETPMLDLNPLPRSLLVR